MPVVPSPAGSEVEVRRLRTATIGAVVLAAAVGRLAQAQEPPGQVRTARLSGLAFGDAYYVGAHHDSTVQQQRSGFWMRRAYLTVDYDLGRAFSSRFRFEVNSPGDFKTSANLVPYVKDLWLRWRGSTQELYVGISPAPTWELVETTWGYRSVEKTPLDLQKLGDSRDFGLALKGRLDGRGVIRYHAMLGNGAGTKSETNAGKKGMLAVAIHPTDHAVLEAYADYEGRPDSTDRATLQGFAALQGPSGRLGLLGAVQWRQAAWGWSSLRIASAFGVVKLSHDVHLLGRYDRMFDANPEADKIAYFAMAPSAQSNLLLGGVDITLQERVHVIPNLEAVFYSDAGTGRPGSDVFWRLTFDVTF